MIRSVLSLAALTLLASATPANEPKTDTQREREVKVALALATVEAKPAAIVAAPKSVSRFDWFGDEAQAAAKSPACTCTDCKCKNCPADCVHAKAVVKAEPVTIPVKYRTEKQCMTYYDRYGRPYTQCTDVLVPILP